MINWNEYTVMIPTDASAYGDACSEDAAKVYATRLMYLVEREYEGINAIYSNMVGVSKSVTGPDSSVCDDIHMWILDNWTSVL